MGCTSSTSAAISSCDERIPVCPAVLQHPTNPLVSSTNALSTGLNADSFHDLNVSFAGYVASSFHSELAFEGGPHRKADALHVSQSQYASRNHWAKTIDGTSCAVWPPLPEGNAVAQGSPSTGCYNPPLTMRGATTEKLPSAGSPPAAALAPRGADFGAFEESCWGLSDADHEGDNDCVLVGSDSSTKELKHDANLEAHTINQADGCDQAAPSRLRPSYSYSYVSRLDKNNLMRHTKIFASHCSLGQAFDNEFKARVSVDNAAPKSDADATDIHEAEIQYAPLLGEASELFFSGTLCKSEEGLSTGVGACNCTQRTPRTKAHQGKASFVAVSTAELSTVRRREEYSQDTSCHTISGGWGLSSSLKPSHLPLMCSLGKGTVSGESTSAHVRPLLHCELVRVELVSALPHMSLSKLESVSDWLLHTAVCDAEMAKPTVTEADCWD